MAKITVLEKSVAELIAAGEVVERPASVIKELVENSIDAGATAVTVEIQNGGVTFMRVTDNGCGIAPDEVSTAFLRHATSKIKTEEDLDRIFTLGFRGEALAAVSSVSRVEMLTKIKENDFGTNYIIEGGVEKLKTEAGCPDGTTIIIRDLFFNTPARMKFLRKDVAEGNAVAGVIDRMALSHPEVSFRFIRDGKTTLLTKGNGDLYNAIYDVCKKDFASTLIPVNNELNGIKVSGFVSKPTACRPSHAGQIFFLNGRYIKSSTITAAVDNAYKNTAMVGRFPAAVLNITVPVGAVDVNVHPAKTEVRFSDERRIFDCVIFGIRNALIQGDERPKFNLGGSKQIRMSADEYRQTSFNVDTRSKKEEQNVYKQILDVTAQNAAKKSNLIFNTNKVEELVEDGKTVKQATFYTAPKQSVETKEPPKILHEDGVSLIDFNKIDQQKNISITNETKQPEQIIEPNEKADDLQIKYIGEAFLTYIIVETTDCLYLIDKHAAHERILFNKLTKTKEISKQLLLTPITVNLAKEEYSALVDNVDLVNSSGFEIDDFGNGAVIVRAVPAPLAEENIDNLIFEIAENIINHNTVETEKLDWLFDNISCRAAIKAGNVTSSVELEALAKKVLSDKEIMYCPHGRPVAFKLTKNEIEKQFGRLG